MNSSYPNNHVDFDEKFIFEALSAIYARSELHTCYKTNSLEHLNTLKYSFLKRKHNQASKS